MSDPYESERLLGEYLLFHYGSAEEILPPDRDWPAGMTAALGFPVRTVGHFHADHVSEGLDLGCAVGRSAFEMSKTCDRVLGIDFSRSFVRAAQALAGGEAIPYQRLEEAAIRTPLAASLPDGVFPERVRFMQGDAMHLPADLGSFDRVHAANLLCRLPEPARLLERLPSLVKPGGELVLATPCTWLEEYTPPANWPPQGTFAWLVASLEPHFELVRRAEEPFLIRETARKFQWTTSMVTVWRRR